MCQCKCAKSEETKPELPPKPKIKPILWEEEITKCTEGKLPPGYHIEHCRFGDDDKTGLVAALNTRNERSAEMNYGDFQGASGWGFSAYREVANHLVKKSWKNFLKKGY